MILVFQFFLNFLKLILIRIYISGQTLAFNTNNKNKKKKNVCGIKKTNKTEYIYINKKYHIYSNAVQYKS